MKSTLMLKCFIILSMTTLCVSAIAQQVRDQDLITLKNGYQILGYVVEQHPGKKISIYRSEQNDTVDVKLEDISKLSKIWVQNFSEKKIEDVETEDTILLGRFNNKKYVFQIGYQTQMKDTERFGRKGVSLACYRSLENKWLSGMSVGIFGWQNPQPQYSDVVLKGANHSFMQWQFMFENQFRLSRRPQNRRVSISISANAGYVADFSRNSLAVTDTPNDVEHEEMSGGIMLQTGLVMKINPDSQSGFSFSLGYAHFTQTIEQFAAIPSTVGETYLGYRREINSLFNLRIGYFF